MSNLLVNYGMYSYVSENILIIPFQADFFSEVMQALETEILKEIHAKPNIIAIILDLSKANIIDLKNMRQLERVLKMASVLGVKAYICGLKPEVTLTLVNLGYENKDLCTCLNIEHGISLIKDSIKNEVNMHSQEWSDE